MVKIWTKWEKNLEQKQGQIRALMLPSFNIGLERIRKKKKNSSMNLVKLFFLTLFLFLHSKNHVHLEAFLLKSTK